MQQTVYFVSFCWNVYINAEGMCCRGRGTSVGFCYCTWQASTNKISPTVSRPVYVSASDCSEGQSEEPRALIWPETGGTDGGIPLACHFGTLLKDKTQIELILRCSYNYIDVIPTHLLEFDCGGGVSGETYLFFRRPTAIQAAELFLKWFIEIYLTNKLWSKE